MVKINGNHKVESGKYLVLFLRWIRGWTKMQIYVAPKYFIEHKMASYDECQYYYILQPKTIWSFYFTILYTHVAVKIVIIKTNNNFNRYLHPLHLHLSKHCITLNYHTNKNQVSEIDMWMVIYFTLVQNMHN